MSAASEVLRWTGPIPPGWHALRAKFVMREVDERSHDGSEPLLSLSKEQGVVPRSTFGSATGRADSLVGYKRVRAGQIVSNKMQAWNGLFGLAEIAGVISPDYAVYATLPGFDARFIVAQLRTPLYAQQFLWRSRGMGTAFLRLHPEALLDTPLLLPRVEEQRAIADYLDTETVRIDALLRLRRDMLARLAERRSREITNFLGEASWAMTRVKYLLADHPRYGVLVPEFLEDGGIPFVRVNDLEHLTARSPQRSITPQQSAEYSRTRLAAGDVLVSVVGSLDRSAVVPDALAGANCARAVARLRPLPGVSPDLIRAWMTSNDYLRQATLATGSGTAQPTLNMGDLANFELAFPHDSCEAWARLSPVLDRYDRLSQLLKAQMASARERRDALVTAAVTGRLEVPGVAA